MRPTEPAGRGAAAVVRPGRAARQLTTSRHDPGDLADWVDYFWIVRWDLDRPFSQAVIPQPVVHLAAEDGRLLVHGVGQTSFDRQLTGRGHVIGAAFRAGGFRCLVDLPMNRLARQVRPAGELLRHDDRPVARGLLEPGIDDAALVQQLADYIARCGPASDPVAEQVAQIMQWAEHDRSLVRADALADRADMSLRTLQRHFAEYVGVGPKWVLARFRMLDAAAAAHRGEPVDWAGLATSLGFSDQAHLSRNFRAIVGTAPEAYRREA